jgi:hypothetical protein
VELLKGKNNCDTKKSGVTKKQILEFLRKRKREKESKAGEGENRGSIFIKMQLNQKSKRCFKTLFHT